MGTHYDLLSAEERATMMLMAHEGQTLRITDATRDDGQAAPAP